MKKPLAALAVVASLASCSSSSLTSVGLVIENHPAETVSVSGKGIDVPAGVGVAFVATLFVDGKSTDDLAIITSPDHNCVVSDGINTNEFFMVCNAAGAESLGVADGTSANLGTLSVPVTIVAQPGSMMLPDGGLTPPPDDAAAPDAATVDAPGPEASTPDATPPDYSSTVDAATD